MTLHNPLESLIAPPCLPKAALTAFSKKKHHCTSLAMFCVLPDKLQKDKVLPGTLASRVSSLAQSFTHI